MGKIWTLCDSGVFDGPESDSEVSFCPKNSPGPQWKLLILFVCNCTMPGNQVKDQMLITQSSLRRKKKLKIKKYITKVIPKVIHK
jgi:hypothetical protein